MFNYKINGYEPDEDVIEHYGVKGMKWGVRKDRDSGGPSRPKKTPSKEQIGVKIAKEKKFLADSKRERERLQKDFDSQQAKKDAKSKKNIDDNNAYWDKQLASAKNDKERASIQKDKESEERFLKENRKKDRAKAIKKWEEEVLSLYKDDENLSKFVLKQLEDTLDNYDNISEFPPYTYTVGQNLYNLFVANG